MVYNLSELLQDAYTELGQLRAGRASGGNASTLVDSTLIDEHQDDEWKNGALFLLEAGGSPPESEFARVKGFESSSGTFTFETALSAGVEAGDRYGLVSSYYPIETMIELANAGLRALGDVTLVDGQTLTSVSGASNYALSVEWSRKRPLRIDYQFIPGTSGMDPWRTLHDWDFVPAAQGANGLILFKEGIPAGRKIRVWYQASHPRLNVFEDEVMVSLAPELAAVAVTERALRWQNARLGGGDAELASRWEQARIGLARAKAEFPIWTPKRSAKLLSIGRMK